MCILLCILENPLIIEYKVDNGILYIRKLYILLYIRKLNILLCKLEKPLCVLYTVDNCVFYIVY